MRRVLCLIESLGSGGAERQLVGLAAMLKKDGNEIKVATYVSKEFYKPVLDEVCAEYEYIPDAMRPYKRFFKLAKTIRQYQPDTVITYSPAAAEIACALKRLGMRFKLIVSERATSHSNCRSEQIKFFCYRWADWVVPNSHMQESFIQRNYPYLTSKTKVITNFVNTDFFSPAEENNQPSDVCKIICVGRDDPKKNILRFIEALKILSDRKVNLHVDWYGKFENSYGHHCEKKISDLGLEEYITLKGESKNVRDEYRNHDVLCLPSTSEGFPNVLCEAMSCGLPVVCGNICDNPLILEDSKGGLLFDPTDVYDMAEKIERIVEMESTIKQEMGQKNRERALSMFSTTAFLQKYKELL